MKVYQQPTLELFISSSDNVLYASNFTQETITKDPFDLSQGGGL